MKFQTTVRRRAPSLENFRHSHFCDLHMNFPPLVPADKEADLKMDHLVEVQDQAY